MRANSLITPSGLRCLWEYQVGPIRTACVTISPETKASILNTFACLGDFSLRTHPLRTTPQFLDISCCALAARRLCPHPIHHRNPVFEVSSARAPQPDILLA